MDIVTAIKTCFSKYATFSGRAGRPEFWFWILFTWVGSILCGVLDYAVFGTLVEGSVATVSSAFSLLVALPGLAVGSRRLHDVGRSGWWQLLVITIIGLVPLIYWWASRSRDDSKY